MTGQSTTNGNIVELASVEHDIAQALTKSPPSRDQRVQLVFARPKVRTSSPPMPPYDSASRRSRSLENSVPKR